MKDHPNNPIQRTSIASGDLTPAAASAGEAVCRWLDAALPALRQSDWQSLLHVDGIDVLDAVLSDIYMGLLEQLREPSAPITTPARTFWEQQVYAGSLLKARALEALARRSATSMRAVDVLFWPRQITHVRAQGPVFHALTKMGLSSQFICGIPAVTRTLQLQGFPTSTLTAECGNVMSIARQRGNQLAAKFRELPSVSLPKVADFPLKPEIALQVLRSRVVAALPTVCEYVAVSQHIIQRFRPRVLVVGYDITLEGRVSTLYAKTAGVPTASLMHGSATGNPLQQYHVADRVLLYGENSREEYERLGVAPARIAVVGAPYLDAMQGQTGHTDAAIAKRFRFSDGDPWILVATSGAGHSVSLGHHLKMIENIGLLSDTIPHIPVIIKLHRKDRPELYRRLLTGVLAQFRW